MFIIAGLGNPDEKYQGTRHNVGFDVVDRLAEKYQIAVDTKKHRALIGKGVIEGQKVLLVKPQTYMNLSGESIRSVGEKPKGYDLADYVLGKFSKEDRVLMEEGYDLACEASALIMQGAIDQAMNEYNQKKKE